jgi:glycine hydroxymethyltransferase
MCKGQYADAIDRAVFPGIQAGPLMHIIAAKAVAFKEASSPEFGEYQRQIIRNALVLAETLTSEGFRLVSGGTDNHLMLVDVRELGITGQDAANLLAEAGIIVNKNSIPYDTQPPALGGGFRPGTPALTTRGMMEPEMKQIGLMISRTLHHREDAAVRAQVHEEVLDLCRRFPIYPDLEQW